MKERKNIAKQKQKWKINETNEIKRKSKKRKLDVQSTLSFIIYDAFF